MRTYRFLLLWTLLLAWALCSSAQAQGKKWALLVGVEEYNNPDISRLDFAVKDVTSVADVLKTRLGFAPANVRLMTSAVKDEQDRTCPTNVNIFKALTRFQEDVGPEDTFLFYFSGHGFSKEGQNFLGTIDADPFSADTLSVSAISVERLQSLMKGLKARQVIFVMDACRNDPEKGKGGGDNPLTSDFSKSLIVAARTEGSQIGGSAVLFACSEGERAFEDPSKSQSVFTYYLLEALEGKAGAQGAPLTMADVADYVQTQVRAWAKDNNKKQTPQLLQEGPAKIVLADKITGGGAPVVPDTGGTVTDLDTKAQFSVTSDPPGAKVYLDGVEQAGVVTPATVEVDLGLDKTRQMEVGIQQAGYRPVVKSVQLQRGKRTPIPSITLQRIGDGGAQAKTKINPKDGAEMILIPSGNFLMGDRDRTDNPRHTVTLDAYYIYKNDVTVGMYKKFCQETGRQIPDPPSWGWKDDHPIVKVTWDGAKAYCDWAGVGLPTEAQWEKAARGTDGRKYPWGNEFDTSKCANHLNSTAPVGSFPSGESPYGVLDMAGNVENWCSDWYDENYCKSSPARNPTGPGFGTLRVVRGGSWFYDNPVDFRAAGRLWLEPTLRSDYLGFRGASGL